MQTLAKHHINRYVSLALMAGLFICALPSNAQNLAPSTAPNISNGSELFNGTCAACHGGNGQGSVTGPSIIQRVAKDGDAALVQFLKVGNPIKGMPPAALTDTQFGDLLAYLRLMSRLASRESAAVDTSNQYASIPAIKDFVPVTDATLLNPSPNDWLWFSRTADAQRFSPLKQINRKNVKTLSLAWSRGLPEGLTETIPTVYNGVMYLTLPGGNVTALDATTGDTIWLYKRAYSNQNSGFMSPEANAANPPPGMNPGMNSGRNRGFNPTMAQGMNLGNLPSFVTQGAGGSSRSKSLAIYDDMIYFTAPDETIVALDAKTGALRWESKTEGRGNTTGAIVVEGKVISSGTCGGRNNRDACNITAHDAHTGALVWKFMITQAPGDAVPGLNEQVDTWYGVPVDQRKASSWGLPGSYDAETRTLLWSVANPAPYTRRERHGDSDKAPLKAPVDLYSNSTLAIDPTTGKLKWYYQHLPGDDWDQDMNEERVILRTKVKPDPKHVRWISNKLKPNEERDIVVNVGEGGGLWALDKRNGEFLWATPFPADVKNFILGDIDVNTGATIINREQVLDAPGVHRTVCYFNTRSYWPTAYSPLTNSLYVPYINNCLKMTAGSPATATSPPQFETRVGEPLPGITPAELNGLAKVDMKTGVITRWPVGPIPTNSAILATAGNLIFWGDINRRYRAVDAETGKVLWQTILGGPISNGNITYSVNGRQYVAVLTGANMSHPGLNTGTMGPMRLNLENSGDINAITVFALPER